MRTTKLMNLKLVLIFISFFICIQCQTDSCTLLGNYPPEENEIWIGRPSDISSCFNEIPYTESIRSETLELIDVIWSLYSFSDTSEASIPPYNISV